MNFETFFRLISYATVFCGFLSLWVSGSFGFFASFLFLGIMGLGWFLEDTKWQISEKLGTALIVLALPAFIVAWRLQWVSFSNIETDVAAVLARLILSLSAIKLLQQKTSRDWVFLYLMSFFELMLGAGLSISGLYLLSFLLYVLVIVCAIIALEIRKSAAQVQKPPKLDVSGLRVCVPATRLPVTSIVLILFISLVAVPMFFMLPRVGGAGFAGSRSDRTRSGFSDTVRLGGIGAIQENDAVVMRVKLDGPPDTAGLYFRGIALDTFDNTSWSRPTAKIREPFEKGERDTIQLDSARSRDDLTVQTIYLEPVETNVLFALPRAVLVQGNFQNLYKDLYGAITYQLTSPERVSYKVVSDRSAPSPVKLRQDGQSIPLEYRNYLQLPDIIDGRIAALADQITADSKNRYDKAKAIETFLRSNFGYTLEQNAKGREPLADFLFNVRQGHCEYFATAMSVMLRTQGIPTRIVNGFHGGEYNDTADVTIVRERNAHAWVEVYFPGEDAWVTFDPTPAAGRPGEGFAAGVAGTLRKYAEALETFWIQYFVAFDGQEQRSLARAVRGGMGQISASTSAYMDLVTGILSEWWAEIRGAGGGQARLHAAAQAIGAISAIGLMTLLIRWLFRGILSLGIFDRLRQRGRNGSTNSIVEFYDRMLDIFAVQGIRKEAFQTPLEFAVSTNISEAVTITDRYNRVRFGQRDLSHDEASEIEAWLRAMSTAKN
jgi:transglutaminase-like putative cysteine protease